MNYKYRIYGLNVESEIKIDEAYESMFDSEPDVKVVIGPMPEVILKMYADKSENDSFCATTPNAVAFRVMKVADFWIQKDTITVNPFAGTPERDVRVFILGSCFGYCMYLRKQLLLHGGAVSKYGKGVIVCGESGAGKSTVSDALLSNGYLFIADDTCAISDGEKKQHINMGYPQQKLCRDAAVNKGYDLSKLIYIDEDRDKYAIRLKDGFLPEGKDFDYLFEITVSEDDELSFKKIEGHEKLTLLMRNIFRGEDGVRFFGVRPEYMKECLRAASTVEIYQISRPKNLDTLPQIVDFIDKTVRGTEVNNEL